MLFALMVDYQTAADCDEGVHCIFNVFMGIAGKYYFDAKDK